MNTEQQNIEKAIIFLVDNFRKSGNNPKPVILHSIKVGLMLESFCYSNEVIIAGILHDILEDTEVTDKELNQEFGNKVYEIVKANSFDTGIKDKKEQYKKLFQNCFEYGGEALIVKTADIYQNSSYYYLAEKENYKHLLEKLKYFLDISESLLKNEKIFKLLKKKYNHLSS